MEKLKIEHSGEDKNLQMKQDIISKVGILDAKGAIRLLNSISNNSAQQNSAQFFSQQNNWMNPQQPYNIQPYGYQPQPIYSAQYQQVSYNNPQYGYYQPQPIYNYGNNLSTPGNQNLNNSQNIANYNQMNNSQQNFTPSNPNGNQPPSQNYYQGQQNNY